MKVAVGYVFPTVNLRAFFPAAARFAETFQRHPPGIDHELYVLFNGGQPSENSLLPFRNIPHRTMLHDNNGWDVGAFQKFADQVVCDLMVCFGAWVHFHRKDWLARMVDAYVMEGPGLYGCWAYMSPDVHIRTTSFWFPPELLKSYPFYVGSSRDSRYNFEHRSGSFTRHVLKLGLPCFLTTWSGIWPYPDWANHAPSAPDLLVWDNHGHG